ncbi:MAG: sugar phosphate isomerase/epimerase [Formivibrio sp.]|nr:sugar phosphate isomerase/epimerase [Formivibrio sp.]
MSTAPRAALALLGHPLLDPAENLLSLDLKRSHGPMGIRIGYAAITWGDDLTGAISDISSVGYKGIQLRANAVKLIPDPAVIKEKLAAVNLTFTALSSGDLTLDRSEEAAKLAMHADHAQYLSAAGGKYLQVLGTFRTDGKFTSDEYVRTGKMLTEVGKRATDHGVQIAFHNHMGSIAQSPEQLERILDAADPRYVKLLLDVAHYKQGGGDPATAVKKHAHRILFVNFKDVKPTDTSSGYEFVELGRGTVDLPAVVSALRAINFQNWAIVEFDREPKGSTRTPKESAELSKTYIEHTLGLSV